MTPSEIRDLRQSLGLTQAKFAEQLGVSFATLNRWENGRTPSPLGLAKLQALVGNGKAGDAIEPSPAHDAVSLDFKGDPKALRVLVEGERLSYGHLSNPDFATEVSAIDPLPHQRLAVCEHMRPQNPLRYLLADDAGAGKTIMTGLYVRDSLMRRTIKRVLIVAPAGLVGNWRRELRSLFRLGFNIVASADAKEGNPFVGPGSDLVIASIDSLRRERLFNCLRDSETPAYDLVVFDEAHKLSASKDPDGIIRPTGRYRLAASIAGIKEGWLKDWKMSWSARHLLLLTATPHMGKSFPYYYLWRLLEPELLSTEAAFHRFSAAARAQHFLRRVKEELVDMDGEPLYPQRICDTVSYELAQGDFSEQDLYVQTTDYIRDYYNTAQLLNRQAARFAMAIFQRRLASSTWALLCSLRNRHAKLGRFIEAVQSGESPEQQMFAAQRRFEGRVGADVLDTKTADEEAVTDGNEEHEVVESDALGAFVANNLAELEIERERVQRLINLAEAVYGAGKESKFERMRQLLESPEYREEKVIIYTEHKDTLDFLVRRLEELGYAGQVACIHGGMGFERRDEEVERFRRAHDGDTGARFLIGTDAAAEGINLQFCWLLINYDIPWNPARLEQRMGRIHRYGQKRDKVVIINLVAGKTREGRVVKVLLDKLEEIRKQLGSDKVFDVIGRIFEGKSLTEYLQETAMSEDEAERAVAKQLTAEKVQEIEKGETDVYGKGGEVAAALPRLQESLAAEEMRHLLPGYVRRYLEYAAPLIGIDLVGDLDGYFSLRVRHSKVAEILDSALEIYPVLARERFAIHRPDDWRDAVFLHPGEPVFDCLSRMVSEHCHNDGQRGAIFTDAEATEAYLFHVARVSVVRAADPGFSALHREEDIEQLLVGIKQYADGRVKEAPVVQQLLLKPAGKFTPDSVSLLGKAETLRADCAQHIETDVLTARVERQRLDAERQLNENEAHLRCAYDCKEAELAAARTDYAKKAREGDEKARAELEHVKKRQRGLSDCRELDFRVARMEVELIQPGEVTIIATALVQPPQRSERASDEEIERIAMRTAIDHDIAHGAEVIDVSTPEKARLAGLEDYPGFDLLSKWPDEERCIEVKGRAGSGSVELTENEWARANNMRGKYWLYAVFDCATKPRLYPVQDPHQLQVKIRGVTIGYDEIMRVAEMGR